MIVDLPKLLRTERIAEFNVRAAEGFSKETRDHILQTEEFHDLSVMEVVPEVVNLIHYTVKLWNHWHSHHHSKPYHAHHKH